MRMSTLRVATAGVSNARVVSPRRQLSRIPVILAPGFALAARRSYAPLREKRIEGDQRKTASKPWAPVSLGFAKAWKEAEFLGDLL
jgi:hypothetical protein